MVERIFYDTFNCGYVLKLQSVLQHLKSAVVLENGMLVEDVTEMMQASGFWKDTYCYGEKSC